MKKNVEQEKYVEAWLHGLSERTKTNYRKEFERWLSFLKMTPTEQIEKRLKDLTSQNLNERSFIEQKFREYKQHLEETTTLSAMSVKTMLRTVASFFSRNGLPLALKRGDWESTKQNRVIQTFKLNRDDIKTLYAHASLRDRALLLVLYQSGFSEIDVSELRIEDLKGIWEMPTTEHLFIQKAREKTNQIQATCVSYEALHDIRAMLEERGKPSEGYLFVSQTKDKGEMLDVRRINEIVKTLALKAFGQEKAKEFKTKALRSAYNSALLRANVSPQELKDVMLGHKRLGARGSYSFDNETIIEAYKKAFEHLTINGIQVRQDMKKLEETMNQAIEKKDAEIDTLTKILVSLIPEEKLKELMQSRDIPYSVGAERPLTTKEILELYAKTLKQ